jgi:uncharacterized membrane protein YkoI
VNPIRKAVLGSALVVSTLAGGALGATLISSAGADEATTTTTTAPATAEVQPQRDPSVGGHQANGKTEALLTGTDAEKATAAALAAAPGATIERVETDAEGDAYEAHIVKADGAHATVKFDASFKVTSIETGR